MKTEQIALKSVESLPSIAHRLARAGKRAVRLEYEKGELTLTVERDCALENQAASLLAG
jgi:hypothetical protein